MDTRKAALALAKTIERLAEKNLILEDSFSLSYNGHHRMNPYLDDEVESIVVSFESIKGFADIFKEEYEK